MGTTLMYAAFALIVLISVASHLRKMQRRERAARVSAEHGKLFSEGPRAQHPHIDATQCIGHGLCAEVGPVGAITIVMASPSVGADMPALTPEHETNVTNMFIVGELGGLALIKNAVNQGRDCVDTIAARLPAIRRGRTEPGVHDLCVVGAGPGGISASLRAIERKLHYVTLEQDEFGGTVAKYRRQKLVLTSPVEFPLHGKFTKLKISKEELLKF